MKRFIPFFFVVSSLFATVNKPLRVEWDTGYRNDKIHWYLFEPGTGEGGILSYTELYRDVQFWQNALSFRVIHRDFTFFLNGAYGAFGRGTLYQTYSDLNFTSQHPQFQFNTDGFSADAMGYVGYAVNLTAGRTYEVLLTPLIGYSGHFEHLSRTGGTPNTYTATGVNMTSSCPYTFQMAWNGFLFGVDLAVEPGSRMSLRAGYSYNLLQMHVDANYTYTNNGQSTQNQLKVVQSGNPGQSGWAEIAYMATKVWKIGFGASINYFPSIVVNTNLDRTTNSIDTTIPTQFKLRWTAISGWLGISGAF